MGAVLALALSMTGCDAQFDLNECDGAPAPPTDGNYLNLTPGTAVVDGPEGRLDLAVQIDTLTSTGNSFFALGATVGQMPRITLSSDPTDLSALVTGDETSVSVFYHVTGSGQGGPGRLRITSASAETIEGTFAGCVRAENRAIPIYGPYRVVRGGFNAAKAH